MSDKSKQASALDDFELEDMARSALQEGLSFGVNLDVFMRFAKRIASAALSQQPAPAAVPDDLRARCAEILNWRKSGVLTGDALRTFAGAQWYANEHNSLQMAEADTAREAYALIAENERLQAEHPTDAMLDDVRKRGLSIDGDNAYKRDLIDCIIGTLMLGKQGSNPPPAGHWAQQFWEMARAEGEIQESLAAASPAAPAPAAQEPVAWIIVDEQFHGAGGVEAGEWDVEFERKAIDELATANSPGRIPLYTAQPAAEQPDSTTSDRYLAELYDEVWEQARMIGYGNVTEALAELERMKAAERERIERGQPDTVPVRRELLERATNPDSRRDRALARAELRGLLAGVSGVLKV